MSKQIIEKDMKQVNQVLSTVLGCSGFSRIARLGGLTNHTYHVTLANAEEYVIRIPGEGTEEMIIRGNERISTELACRLGVDAEMLYFGEDGTKVTRYIPNAVTMSAELLASPKRIRQVAEIFRVMHTSNADTGVPFEVFDMAASYEKIIGDMQVPLFEDYAAIKQEVMAIKDQIDAAMDIKKVPCHNDPLCENWVLGNGRMYLIDWEYAGMNDGMWDLADVSIEACFGDAQDKLLLTEYLDREPDIQEMLHFYANKIYVDYLWTLWAKARVPYDGQPMEDWAVERYTRMKASIQRYQRIRAEKHEKDT